MQIGALSHNQINCTKMSNKSIKQKNAKIKRYTSMTAVAADFDATDAAAPRAEAHVVLVKNGDAIHEHCHDALPG